MLRPQAGRSLAQPRGELSDQQVKHLEFIQNVISRMAANSFFAKGWAITVSAAIFGFAASRVAWGVAAVGLLPVVSFWWLDAFFLRQERMYRCLYDEARLPSTSVELFDLNARHYCDTETAKWWKVIHSTTIVAFYGSLFVAGVAVLIALIVQSSSPAQASHSSSASSSLRLSDTQSPLGQISPIASPSQRGTTCI